MYFENGVCLLCTRNGSNWNEKLIGKFVIDTKSCACQNSFDLFTFAHMQKYAIFDK